MLQKEMEKRQNPTVYSDGFMIVSAFPVNVNTFVVFFILDVPGQTEVSELHTVWTGD